MEQEREECAFFFHIRRAATVLVLSMMSVFLQEQNRENAVSGARTQFVLANAENYEVPSNVSFCYFFNPFSVEILKRVVARILESYYENPRPIQLMFYYPSDEYVSFLMTQDELMFSDEIDCRDLFDGNDSREKILVFDVG